MKERKNRILRIQYMATWCDGKFDVNMMSSGVVRTRHHIRRFLHRSLVLKIKPNIGQTLGNSDKIERSLVRFFLSVIQLTWRLGPVFTGNLFFFAFLHKYPLLIGSLERSDRAESGISRTFEKKRIFWWSYEGKKKSDFEDPIYGYLMWWEIWRKYVSSEVVHTRHRIRRFLRRSLVLKIKPNIGQTLGNSDKIERRKIWLSLKGGPFWLLRLWRLSILV